MSIGAATSSPSPALPALARPGGLGEDGGYLRGSDRALAAVVDLAGRHLRGGVAGDGGADARRQGFHGIAQAPDLRAADGAFYLGGDRNPVVGCRLGCAAVCHQPDRQAAGAAAVVLSLRTLDARHVGIHGVSGFLHAADGDVVGRRFPSRSRAKAGGRRRAGHLRQKLYRPKPGIRAVRGGADLSDHHAAAREKDFARLVAGARSR